MRNIFKVLITALIFCLGNQYFSEYIAIADTKTLIIATLFMVAMNYLFGFIMLTSIAMIPLGIGCITTTILFFIAFVFTPIKLLLLNHYLPGFSIEGFWTYVILTVVLSIFSVKTAKKERND